MKKTLLQFAKIRPRFHLITVLLLFPTTGLLLWANLERKIVAPPPSDPIPGSLGVDVYVSWGWPMSYRRCQFLVKSDGVDVFVTELPDLSDWPKYGAFIPKVDRLRLAVDIAVAVLCALGVVFGSELTIRYRTRARMRRGNIAD